MSPPDDDDDDGAGGVASTVTDGLSLTFVGTCGFGVARVGVGTFFDGRAGDAFAGVARVGCFLSDGCGRLTGGGGFAARAGGFGAERGGRVTVPKIPSPAPSKMLIRGASFP